MVNNNQNEIALDDVMTVDDVANYLKTTKNFVYNLIKDDKIKCYKMSKKAWRIPKKSLQDYLDNLNR